MKGWCEIMQGLVLIVEDERDIAELIQLYLEREGMVVHIAGSGESGLKMIEDGLAVDLVVLDLNLPGLDGYEFLRTLRGKLNVPVVIVSARNEDSDMIMGFGIGADDFVPKPFSPGVLAARIRAHIRRRRESPMQNDCFRFGPCELDRRAMAFYKNGARIALSPRELQLLIYLAEEPDIPRSQQDIYSTVWKSEYGDINTVSVHIQRLRQKIEDDPSHPRFIKTVYGFGYTLSQRGNE